MKTKTPTRRNTPASKAAKALPAKLVRIGNSRGVRLPKAVIEQAGLGDDIEMSVSGNEVVIRSRSAPAKDPRAGWEEQIKKVLAEHGDDVDDWRDWHAIPTEFDDKEWTW